MKARIPGAGLEYGILSIYGGTKIDRDCNIGKGAYIDADVAMGGNVKVRRIEGMGLRYGKPDDADIFFDPFGLTLRSREGD